MSIKLIEEDFVKGTRTYKIGTTDDKTTIPVIGNGDKLIVVNETTHEVDHYEFYDGDNWNII